MSDLIVDDESCSKAAHYLAVGGVRLDRAIKEYIGILEKVKSNGIIEGDTAAALENYILAASELKNLYAFVSDDAKRVIESFVRDIDEKDQFLY